MNYLRCAYYFLLANFWPCRLQAIADRAYAKDLRVAEAVVDTYWLLGCEVKFMELRSAEICRECWRECFVFFQNDQQCPTCMKSFLDKYFSQKKGRAQCQ
jgi:hypothetical protein